jgi:transposase
MRWSIERLSQRVQQMLNRSLCDGTAYGFTAICNPRLEATVRLQLKLC